MILVLSFLFVIVLMLLIGGLIEYVNYGGNPYKKLWQALKDPDNQGAIVVYLLIIILLIMF